MIDQSYHYTFLGIVKEDNKSTRKVFVLYGGGGIPGVPSLFFRERKNNNIITSLLYC